MILYGTVLRWSLQETNWRNMKKIISILVALMVLAGCSAKPDATAKDFIEAIKHSDAAKIALLAGNTEYPEEDDMFRTFDDMSPALTEYIKEYNQQISYEVMDSKVQGEVATVTAKVTYKDGGDILIESFMDYLQRVLTLVSSHATEEDLLELFTEILCEKMETAETEEVTKEVTFDMVKVDDKWVVANPSEELFDVMTAGMYSAFMELEGIFSE